MEQVADVAHAIDLLGVVAQLVDLLLVGELAPQLLKSVIVLRDTRILMPAFVGARPVQR